MKYISFSFLMLLLCQSAFSQSKKEQIANLIYQKDSLGKVLEKERQLNTDQVKQLESKISKINADMALIKKEIAKSKMELTDSKKELAAKKEEIEGFRVGTSLRDDIIRSLREGSGYGYAWYVGFTLGNEPFYNEFTPVHVRAVRDN